MNVTVPTFPGEAAIVAIANMVVALAEGQTPEQKRELWQRYLEFTAPWHKLAVEANKELVAAFVEALGKQKPQQ